MKGAYNYRVRPAFLLAVFLLSACAAAEPRRPGAYASWLAEKPRTVRILVAAPVDPPLYYVEWHNVSAAASDGVSTGILVGGLIFGGMSGSCDGGCANAAAAIIGGAAVIGGLIGAVTAPAKTLLDLPLGEHDVTRPLVPVLQRTGQDIVRRSAEMFAANLRRKGGHVVLVEVGALPWCEPSCERMDSEITMAVSSIGLAGPGPNERGRASLRIGVELRARWGDSTRTQRFHYKSDVLDLSDWADEDGVVAGDEIRLAFANLAGQTFDALAEP